MSGRHLDDSDQLQLAGQMRARLCHTRQNLMVRFAPGARNAWHSHAAGQTLHVTEGRGLLQSRGDQVIEIRPGDTIWTPPGEWHWHGATPDHFMTHIAIWEAPDDDRPETEWGDLVTDEEYGERGPRAVRHRAPATDQARS
jgi:quercetin dioxygenase-like cupin family protein